MLRTHATYVILILFFEWPINIKRRNMRLHILTSDDVINEAAHNIIQEHIRMAT